MADKRSAEIVIVGGGIIGLAIARALAVRGVHDILLIERGVIGRESSFAAAGIIAPQAEADESNAFFRLASASRDLYSGFAGALQQETGIDVELDTTGTLYLAFTFSDEEEMQRRFEWQTRAGLPVEQVTATESLALEPSISRDVRAALRFPLDIQVENRLLIEALAVSCKRYGISFLTDTTVHSLRSHSGRVAGVDTSRGFVASGIVIVAGGAWTSMIGGLPAIPIEPVKGQILCFQSQPRPASHVLYSPRGYIVPRRDGRLLAGSTMEHAGYDKAVSIAGLEAILSHAVEISPRVQLLPQVASWAGLRPRAADNLPVLGPYGEIEGLVYATGHYRNGILLAPITGELLATAIIDKALSPLLTAFTADRFRDCSLANSVAASPVRVPQVKG